MWVWVWEVQGREGYLESWKRCAQLRIACSVVLAAGGPSTAFDEDKAGRTVRKCTQLTAAVAKSVAAPMIVSIRTWLCTGILPHGSIQSKKNIYYRVNQNLHLNTTSAERDQSRPWEIQIVCKKGWFKKNANQKKL